MKIFAGMAAIAFIMGITGQEIWTVEDPVIGFEYVAEVVEQPEQCLTAQIETDGQFVKFGNSDDWILTGGLEQGRIRIALVGKFVWVATGYDDAIDSIDMVIWSVPVEPGDDSVTICIPQGKK